MPQFSVVIPAYNREDSILAAIESVRAQEVTDWEIIVVDDGSTDQTATRVESLAEDRIRLIKQKNRGGSAARNAGIDAARGQFIAFLDSDDVWLPHHLSQALPLLTQEEACCTYARIEVDRGDGVTFHKPPRALGENEHISDYLLCDRGFVPTSSLIVPAGIAQKVRFDEELPYGQDTDFALRLWSYGIRFSFISSPSARVTDQSTGGRVSSGRHEPARTAWLQRVRHLLTPKAYHGDRGWTVAKFHSAAGHRRKAFALYFIALIRGCYAPKMALVVFLQVMLSAKSYRKLSDHLARLGIGP
jgi:glycosyltransferase involved in cell wall biosynthesis